MKNAQKPLTVEAQKFLELIGAVKMPRFICIKQYQNKDGDISDYVIGINHSYKNKVNKDIEKLTKLLTTLPKTGETALTYTAAVILLEAFRKNLTPETASNQSKAQKDAYSPISRNIRKHNENGKYYLSGYCISKVSHFKAEVKPKKSAPITIAKDKLRATFKTSKFVTFGLDFDGFTVQMEGETLTLTNTSNLVAV